MIKAENIKINNFINFKNAQIQKKSNKDNKEQNPKIGFQFMDFENYKKTALYNSIDSMGANHYDFNDYKEYTLKNNLKVCIDKSDLAKEIEGKILITPKDDVDNLKLSLLADMMRLNKTSDRNKDGFYIGIGKTNTQLYPIFYSDNKNLKNCLEALVDTLSNPVLSEELLEQAKNQEKEFIKEPNLAIKKAEDYIVNKNKEITAQDIDKVTLGDIKKFHNEILTNSQANIIFLVPKDFSNENEILNTLSKFPTLKPFDEKYFKKTILPQNENKTFYSRICDKPEYAKLFVLENNATLKNELTAMLLYDYYLEIIKRNYNEKELTAKSNYLAFENEGAIMLGAVSKDSKKSDINALKKAVDLSIEKLMSEKINKEDLDKIKKERKYKIIKDYKYNFFRADIALNRFRDADNTLKSQLKILESITAEDIQEAAKNCFAKPYIEAIEEQI